MLLITVVYLSGINSYAQKSTSLDQDIQKLDSSIKSLGKLFSKKDKTNSGLEDKKDKAATDDNGSVKKENDEKSSSKKSGALQPGDIAPDAKVIDADYLHPFNKGAAVVTKGTAYGLIDMTGNFIVPYNKYRKIESGATIDTRVTKSGIFLINGWEGAIDAKGKLITAGYPGLSWGYGNVDGTLIMCTNPNKPPIYLDAEGRKYSLKQYLSGIVDGIGMVHENSRIGYKNLKDEWIVKPTYSFAEPFSEGMACVGNINEFGETKYGFIDRTGKEVIGLIYTRKPDNFHGGVARVTPKNNPEFKEAYIDKKGNIVKKLEKVGLYTYLGNGFYLGDGGYVLDSTGRIDTEVEFLRRFGVVLQPATQRALSIGLEKSTDIANFSDEKICFTRLFKESGAGNFGSINLRTKEVMEGPFHAGTYYSLRYFDPVSKLAHTQFNVSRNFRDKIPLRDGYVNEQGIFVIIIGEASKW